MEKLNSQSGLLKVQFTLNLDQMELNLNLISPKLTLWLMMSIIQMNLQQVNSYGVLVYVLDSFIDFDSFQLQPLWAQPQQEQ